MQTIRLQFHNIISSKSKLLATITAVIIAIMAIPVILPHITDKSTIYHIFLHIASVIIAIFLAVVSILAYLRNRRSRLLFMTFAFFSLSVIEAMYLFHVSSNMEDLVIPGVDIEISHVIFLIMLSLFGIGIFRTDK
jgi:chromate transport protein ChrA